MCIRRRRRCGFGRAAFVHDFVRDSVRTALMKARPAASFFRR